MLTLKQENFCLVYIESDNASEAYRQSYDAGRMKPETVNRETKILMDNHKITARIKELRAPVIEATKLTLEKHLATLAQLRDDAAKNGVFGAAVSAEIARGKAAELYVEKHEVKTGVNPYDVLKIIEERRATAQIIDVTPETASAR